MKKVFLSILVVTALFLGAGWYFYNNPEGVVLPQLIPPDYYWLKDKKNLYAKTGIVEIAGRQFRMPVAYVDGHFKDGRIERSVVLLYVLPDYTSRLDFKDQKSYHEAFRNHRFGHMLLDDGAHRPSFDVMVANRKRMINKSEPLEAPAGLEGYVWYQPWNGKLAPYYHIYIEKDKDGHVISWLDCSTEVRGPNPGCSQHFKDKGLYYDVYFDVAHLENWVEQRNSAIDFIDSMEINNGN